MIKKKRPGGPVSAAKRKSDEELGFPGITVADGTVQGEPLKYDVDEGGGYSDDDDSEEPTDEETADLLGDPAQFDELPVDLMPDYSDLGPAEGFDDEEE